MSRHPPSREPEVHGQEVDADPLNLDPGDPEWSDHPQNPGRPPGKETDSQEDKA